jgi:Cys-tRNA(Pro) deacylase
MFHNSTFSSKRFLRNVVILVAEAVKGYLGEHDIKYRLHAVTGPTITAQDAATRLNVPLERVIKSILFMDEKQTPILAILTGDKRIDKKKLASVLGIPKAKIAPPEATKTLAGFEVGVMPPVAHKNRLMTVIDRKAMSFDKVYGGSGTADALMEIDPHDIARLTDAKVADISE